MFIILKRIRDSIGLPGVVSCMPHINFDDCVAYAEHCAKCECAGLPGYSVIGNNADSALGEANTAFAVYNGDIKVSDFVVCNITPLE